MTSSISAGVDDAHFYRADDIGRGRDADPGRRVLDPAVAYAGNLPEAAAAGFDLMLSGHTHGGQLCLPGGIPIKLEARLPRSMGAGAWRYAEMAGYTSVGAGTSLLPVRLNCPPEITLHTLRRKDMTSVIPISNSAILRDARKSAFLGMTGTERVRDPADTSIPCSSRPRSRSARSRCRRSAA